MGSTPWLSIVVPAYNAEKKVGECISSFNLATNSDVEVIVVDDGSTDSTPQICDELAGIYENLKIFHRENGGSPSARNAGCAYAKGDWIWFVDADDVIAPYALDALRNYVDGTSCDAIQIEFLRFFDGEKPDWPFLISFENHAALSSEEYLREIYRGNGQHYTWSFVFRAEALLGTTKSTASISSVYERKDWPFRENFSLYEDVVSMEEILRRINGVDILRAQCYGYRQSAFSMTQKPCDKSADSGLRAVRDLAKYDAVGEYRGKLCLEISLLFNAYKLIERKGPSSDALRLDYRHEIERRVRKVGLIHLGFDRLGRLTLLKTGLLDFIFKRRYY